MINQFALIQKYLYQGTFGMGLFFLLDIFIFDILFPGETTNMDNMLGGLLCSVTILMMTILQIDKEELKKCTVKQNLFAVWIGFLVGALLTAGEGWIGVAICIAISFIIDRAVYRKKMVKNEKSTL